MTTVLLVRHGLTALTGAVLAGWTPGIHLNERGRAQAAAVDGRLAAVRLDAVVSSPLERCLETAQPIAARHGLSTSTDERFGETRYGEWNGRELKTLRSEPLWKQLMASPSSVTFPGGEAFGHVQARAVAAIRDWNERLGPKATYVVCSHADVIAAIAVDAFGSHFDQIHRLAVSPASVTVIRYAPAPVVMRFNDDNQDLGALLAPPRRRGRTKTADAPQGDQPPGGSAGTG